MTGLTGYTQTLHSQLKQTLDLNTQSRSRLQGCGCAARRGRGKLSQVCVSAQVFKTLMHVTTDKSHLNPWHSPFFSFPMQTHTHKVGRDCVMGLGVSAYSLTMLHVSHPYLVSLYHPYIPLFILTGLLIYLYYYVISLWKGAHKLQVCKTTTNSLRQ